MKAVRALVPLAAVLLAAGCGGSGSGSSSPTAASSGSSSGSSSSGSSSSGSSSSGSSSPSAEPSPAVAQAAAEAAADPAAAADAKGAALATALRAADLPAGWTVQANPVPDGDLSANPSLAGICGGTFPSESHRTAKFPVVGLDQRRTPAVVSEAISYDSAGSATSALHELRDAFGTCTSADRTLVDAPRVEGLAGDFVVVEYDLAGGTRQEVIAQARGAVVSILIAEDENAAATAARAIAVRLAALPAGAVGS